VREAIRLLSKERDARLFFAALLQSSVGTGAGYVALLLIAYERYRSPWAISLILLADFLPVMVLGPLFGAAADRWSRRWCVVLADLVRAAAFVGIALVGSFGVTLALALAAGAGTALFRPAALAGVPSLVARNRADAATSLFSATTQVGWTAGPALAALGLLATSPENVTVANGITFALSALVLVRLPLDRSTAAIPVGEEPLAQTSLFREGLRGWRTVASLVDIQIVLLASTGAMFFGGIFNVAEPLFATETLRAGEAGYSVLVAVYGLGFIVGSLAGAGGGESPLLRRRYVQGLALTAIGSTFTFLAPGLALALVTFGLAGFGNGLFVVHERLIIQRRVPEGHFGRAFGLADTLVSWALASSFLIAGVIASWTSPRGLILITAVGELVVASLAFALLRWRGVALSGRELATSARSPAS
jgi:MFS family permease